MRLLPLWQGLPIINDIVGYFSKSRHGNCCSSVRGVWKYLARFTVRERKVKRTGRPGAIVPRRRNARLGIYRSRGTFRGYNGAC